MNQSILVKTLNQIVSDYGKDVLQNGTQVVNLFADYCPGEMKEKAKLKSAYEQGVIQELIKNTTGKKNASAAVNKAIQDLKDKAFMDEAIARAFIYEIADVLKLNYTPDPQNQSQKTSTTVGKASPSITQLPSNASVKVKNQAVASTIKQSSIKQDKKKKILFIVGLIALLILITAVVFIGANKRSEANDKTSEAIDEENRNYCDLELSSDGTYYTATGYHGNDSVVVIPEYYNGKPVKCIASEFSDSIAFKLEGVVDIIIPDTVTRIEDGAFAHCYSLLSISIPNSVTYIGKQVFYSCASLTSIAIPNSVTYIGECAFAYCTSLYTINFNGTEEQWWSAIPSLDTYKGDKSEYRVLCTDGTIYHSASK